MPSAYGPRFDAYRRKLERAFPAKLPTRVATVAAPLKNDDGEECCGTCHTMKRGGKPCGYVVMLVRGMDFDHALTTLIHEWGHVVDADRHGEPTKHHRKTWGECFAEIWHEIIEKGE